MVEKEKIRRVIRNSEMVIADYPGEKGPVILIHGLTGNYMQVEFFALSLQRQGYRVIAPNLKGRGESDRSPKETSIREHAEDILRIIEEMKLEKPFVCGYSMGAFIASLVAKISEVKGLILLDGGCRVSEKTGKIIAGGLDRLDKEYPSTAAYIGPLKEDSESLGIAWNEHLQDFYAYELTVVRGEFRPQLTRKEAEEDLKSMIDFQPKEVFSKISCPVFLVRCRGYINEEGPLFPLEDYKDTISSVDDFEEFDTEVNHYALAYEEQRDVEEAIGNFLEKSLIKQG